MALKAILGDAVAETLILIKEKRRLNEIHRSKAKHRLEEIDMRPAIPCFLLATVLSYTPIVASADDSATISDALSSGKLNFSLRPRYENVDQTGKETGDALTMRTLLGWQTATWKGWSGMAEIINVGRANSNYNDSLNGKTQYPVIPDPDDTDFNQLYLDYGGIQDSRIRGGRQSIKLDNVRFVGNVQFRQVMQVFNAVSFVNESLTNTRLYAAYLGRVKTITTKEFDTETVLLNAHYALTPDDALVGYGYLQDQQNAIAKLAFQGPAPTDTSNQIIGVRANGAHPMSEKWRLLYTAEYAKQGDYAGGDSRIDADYTRIGGGAKWGNYTLRADYEVLGSNDGLYAFQTPLATKHLFQGWTDTFAVATPSQGIRDAYVTGELKFKKFKAHAEYHEFDSDFGSVNFGKEFDIGVSYPFLKRLLGKIEYADYQAGDLTSGKVDVRKYWLTLVFNY
jgi:hypothetical protein